MIVVATCVVAFLVALAPFALSVAIILGAARARRDAGPSRGGRYELAGLCGVLGLIASVVFAAFVAAVTAMAVTDLDG